MILLSVSALFCPLSVGWLRWLFSLFLSVYRVSRSFIISELYIRFGPSLRCIAHRLLRVSRFVVCYIAVPSFLCLCVCRPPVTSVIVRPPHHLCSALPSFTASVAVAVVSVGASSSEITSPSIHVYALHPFLLYFLILLSQVGLPLAVSASAYPVVLPLPHQVWLIDAFGFHLYLSTFLRSVYAIHSRTLSFNIPSVSSSSPSHSPFLPATMSPVSLKFTLFPLFRFR